ncbi:MAG: putative DNA binding domain-containing protein [Sphaerochaeta sp.]|jgi:ATP-dependent DNA helicase RecG|nr:putative DNA binding domain-containing protein [Sphaerochaeta sp.]
MEHVEILTLLSQGENRSTRFKKNVFNGDALACEIVAFSNGEGGRLFIGVDSDGTLVGLSRDDIQRLNPLIAGAADSLVFPPVSVTTQVTIIEERRILILEVPEGSNKPYQGKNGVFWVTSSCGKRKAATREALQSIFQASGKIRADVTPSGLPISDLDLPYFSQFFERRYAQKLADQSLPLDQVLHNMNLAHDGELNLAGALLFGRNPSIWLPSFIVKASAFPGTTLAVDSYIDSRNIEGKMGDIFGQTMSFILTHIFQVQGEQTVNTVGIPEIPRIVFEELVTNALIHRDYFISAPIRVFVFSDRIEIISPGHLPNNLTVENIKAGNSNARNPVLASFAHHILPYRGYGSGIVRALELYPSIDFIDDRDGNLFTCIIRRGVA